MYNPEAITIEFKVEVAYKKVLIAGGIPEAQIFTGENAQPKTLPAIICKCQGGQEDPKGSNNYLLNHSVCVQSSTDLNDSGSDPMLPHRRLVKRVRDILWAANLDGTGIESLHTALSAQLPNFTAFPEIENEGVSVELRDRKIEHSQNFRGLFCESDLISDFQPTPPAPSLPQLFEIQMALPCIVWIGNPPYICSCLPSITQIHNFTDGITGQYYEFTIRVRGLVETKNYYGGTNDGGYFQTGGQPADDAWNIFSLAVSDPPLTYYFNRTGGSNAAEIPIDYTCKILARSGATMAFKMDSIDSVEASNVVQKAIVQGVSFVGQPYIGEFIQLEAVSVRPV